MRISGALAVVLLCFAASASAAENNPVMSELLDKGISITANQYDKLPAPTMVDGLDAAAQKKIIQGISDVGHPVEDLMRRSITAPLIIKKEGLTRGENTLRRLDIWFIAYGDLDAVANEGFLKEQIQEEEEAEKKESAKKPKPAFPTTSKSLTDEQVKARGITLLPKTDTLRERYIAADVTLFDKVKAQGTARAFQIRTPDSVLGCAILDPRFSTDKEFPNQWQKLALDENTGAVKKVGQPLPYSGVGGYLKATKLREPSDAIFVEYHLMFNEPKAWFNGANLLDSKFTIAGKDGAEKFRKSLLKKQKAK